jgi:Ni,Fe-hydrogenase I large subunit
LGDAGKETPSEAASQRQQQGVRHVLPKKIVVDPVTRIEGHLRFETRVENGEVVEAHCSGEMFRGIEAALIGHDARVAQQVTQRVCGVCPYAHAEAASLALEDAMGIRPNRNGQLLRNLIVGAYQLQDYLLHFYTLCALDFIDVTAVLDYKGSDAALIGVRDWVASELGSKKIFPAAPFLPRYEAEYVKNRELNLTGIRHYLEALSVMADLHRMVAIFGAKAPHPVTIEAGGVTTVPTVDAVMKYQSLLSKVTPFIEQSYFNDLLGVAQEFSGYFKEGRGYGNLLSYNFLPDEEGGDHMIAGGATLNGRYSALDMGQITEDHRHSYYENRPDAGVRPLDIQRLEPVSYQRYQQEQGKTAGKYSWTRSPRYAGQVMEVGPVARVVNTYKAGTNPQLTALVDRFNRDLGIGLEDYPSVMGRHLSRYILAHLTLGRLERDLARVQPGTLAYVERDVPRNAQGMGLTEATRGGLAHWIETDGEGRIANYELIVPTTWNISPRDADGRPGAVEKMSIGTRLKDPSNPMELARIVRSTDPCMACSVH